MEIPEPGLCGKAAAGKVMAQRAPSEMQSTAYRHLPSQRTFMIGSFGSVH